MTDSPRSNRPTPRTPASVEAELRRRIALELAQARSEAEDGQLTDEALAGIIARATSSVLTWHLEAPEHTRDATLSSRTWRGAGGPRGGRPGPSAEGEDADGDEDETSGFRDRGRQPRPFDRPRREFGERGGFGPRGGGNFGPRGGSGGGGFGQREGGFGPRDGGGFGQRGGGYGNRPPRDFDDRPRRDFGDRPPRDGGDRPGRDFGGRPPRDGDGPGRDFGDRGPRSFGPRDDEGGDRDVPPRRSFGRPPFSGRGGRPPFGKRPGGGGGGFSRGGGFGPRRPPRPR